MVINQGLYLSQSYQDGWEDYQRSLLNQSFPTWDYIILTASNAHQAQSFHMQLDARKAYLSGRTKIIVIPDEGGVRIGSGGATLSALKAIRDREKSFKGLRIMVIHSGGDSKRAPQYSALGKLFSPVPHMLPDGRSSTLFDELIIAMSAVPGRIREGMLLLAGDVLLLFNPLLIDYSGHGAAVISFKEDAEKGKNHGVYLRDNKGKVRQFLHKQSVSTLKAVGAVNESGAVDIDTGAVILGTDVLDDLWSLISLNGVLDQKKYTNLVNPEVCLSLYGDFQYPMATDSTLEQYYREASEGRNDARVREARTSVWEALSKYQMKLIRMAPAKFIHFGTSSEIIQLMTREINDYASLDWNGRINCSMDERATGYNSVLSPGAEIGANCYIEVSYVHHGARVGDNCILSFIDIHRDETIPSNVVVHGLKQTDGRFVCRIYAIDDNPKGNVIFGTALEQAINRLGIGPDELWEEGEVHLLWNAKLYPVCGEIRDAVRWAIALYEMMVYGNVFQVDEWRKKERKSLCSGFNEADPKAIRDWNNRMCELVEMNTIADMIERRLPASKIQGKLGGSLTPIQRQWMEKHISQAGYSRKMRLYYYVGSALTGVERENSHVNAFKTLQSALLKEVLTEQKENTSARIVMDRHEVSLPLRVNWGGGWSDTPPYCNENGGTVLNAAILMGDVLPVRVRLEKIDEKRIVLASQDMDAYAAFEDLRDLQAVGDPFDAFVLQKAALIACGIIPAHGGSLVAVLDRLGGGFRINTEVIGIPKGSGLGTSSILAGACVKGLLEFMGIEYQISDLYSHVLRIEQIMSTGGGWQDQVGGLTFGIKYITSQPGLNQSLKVEHLALRESVMKELNERFVLIYTGQRRLARNLLRDVVGRYIGNEAETMYALNEIQRVTALMRFELERGHIDDFAKLLDEHWKLSKMIDYNSTNTMIDQIFNAVDDLLVGRMICGAGGGGFLQGILKKDVSKEELRKRLKEIFLDTDIDVWDCKLV